MKLNISMNTFEEKSNKMEATHFEVQQNSKVIKKL